MLLSADTQWPAPVEALNERGSSPFLLVCEHASNHVPDEYAGLGLPPSELARHIAWDIGAADLARRLSVELDAPAFLASYSRLLIDVNRPTHVAASIPTRSEATEIPGNIDLAAAERQRRIERIFTPFHQRIERHLDARRATNRPSLLIAVHSFTRTYLGKTRPWDAGVLFDEASCRSTEFGRAIVASLGEEPTLKVAANVPYSVHPDEDYGLLVHGEARGWPSVLLEICNDGLSRPEDCDAWTRRLARALTDASRAIVRTSR